MRILSVLLFSSLSLFASGWPTSQPGTEEEGLFLRRIADFWQEGEWTIAKNQMEEFLASYPESSFADPIRICLGDLFFRAKNYTEALQSYSSLSSPEFTEKTILNRLQCLYCLEWYATLTDECETYLTKLIDSETHQKITYFLALSLYQQCLYRERLKNQQIDEEGCSDFLTGASGSARKHDSSEGEKYEPKLPHARSDSSVTSSITMIRSEFRGFHSPFKERVFFFRRGQKGGNSSTDAGLFL